MGWRAAGVRGNFGEASRPAAGGGWQQVLEEYGAGWRDDGRVSEMLSDWRNGVNAAARWGFTYPTACYHQTLAWSYVNFD